MKKNVLELIGSFEQGGSERQAVQLSRLLNEEGSFRVFVACLDARGPLRDEVEGFGIAEIPEFKLKSFYDANFFRQLRRCASYIRAHEISVVHTHDFYTNIFGMAAAALARVPARLASKRETYSKTGRQEFLERQSFRLADKILVNAGAVKNYLIRAGVKNEKIATVYNGLDLQKFTPAAAPRNRGEITNRLGLPARDGQKFVTIVANLRSEVKNHRMFLRAARKIKDQIEETCFVLAGEGELTESLKEYAASLGLEENAYFIGAVKNVPELLAVSDVCVLSSKSEGFSNAILEYMAAAKPVVATRVGGAAEAVVEGETGFLVDPDDDAAMAQRIVELLSDPKKAARFGRRGREIIEAKFSSSAQLTKTLELYESLLARKGKKIVVD